MSVPSLNVVLPLRFLRVKESVTYGIMITNLGGPFRYVFITFARCNGRRLLSIINVLGNLVVILRELVRLNCLLELYFRCFPGLTNALRIAIVNGLSYLYGSTARVLGVLRSFLPNGVLTRVSRLSRRQLPVRVARLN